MKTDTDFQISRFPDFRIFKLVGCLKGEVIGSEDSKVRRHAPGIFTGFSRRPAAPPAPATLRTWRAS
jgi:hypothetical protein